MKKYYKPASKEIVLDSQVLLAGSIEKDPEGIDGGDVGAKGIYGRIVDDEDENF